MMTFALRNLKLFFRDRTAVFFSMLSVLILIGLYVFFLGDVLLGDLKSMEGIGTLTTSWIVAGILAVTSVTTPLGALGTMVEDNAFHISRDFQSAPVRRRTIAGGYILSACTVGMIMCALALVLSELYLVMTGAALLPWLSWAKLLGILILSVLSGSAMTFFLVSLFKTTKAYATCSTVVGTLIGFVTGIYIPIGTLPEAVQTVIRCFPTSHAAALMRQVLMQAPTETVFSGAPADLISSFQQEMGVTFRFGSFEVAPWMSVAVLVATILIFYGLAILRISRRKV